MSIDSEVLSADEARQFDHFSIHNAVQAQLACPEGECEAYKDIFTLKRWKAQGYFVRKGEKGTRITTWITTTSTDDEGNKVVTGKRPRTAVVFCRHQVEQRT